MKIDTYSIISIKTLAQLQETPVVACMLDRYMENDDLFTSDQDQVAQKVSEKTNKLPEFKSEEALEILGELEYEAKLAGFVAGFRCAAAYLHYLRKQEAIQKASI